MFQQCNLLLFILLVTPFNVHCVTRTTNDDPYFQLVSHGLTSILWSQDDHFETHLSSLSANCSQSLGYIYQGIHLDARAAVYRLLDASAKIPSGILKGTTAALGNYDGCLGLELDDGHGRGQYCTATVELNDPGNSSAIGSLYYRSLPYLKAFDLSFGLCLPSTCTRDEIEKFVTSRISKYPFSLAEYKEFPLDFETPITCETLEETTFYYRLMHLSRAQIISLILMSILPAIVGVSTLLTLIGVKGRIRDFSAQKTIKSLLKYEDPTNGSVFAMEAGKTFLIVAGLLGHSILPVEKSRPIAFVFAPEQWLSMTGTWAAQPWNDGLLGLIPYIAGYACFKFYSTRIISGPFNYAKAILNRYIRLVIVVALVIPMEYLFPLLGDGPIFKLATDRYIRDCDLNWWKHLILDVSSPQTKYCAMYLYMFSIDIKLLVIGFTLLWMFKRFKDKIALSVCASLMIISCIVMYLQVKHLNLPTFISNPADLKLMIESLYATHFILSYYLPGFILGLVIAYIVENNIRLYSPTYFIWFLHYCFFNVWLFATLMAPGLHTILNVIPRPAYGLFIVAHRMMYFILFALFTLLLSHGTFLSMKSVPKIVKLYFVYNGKVAGASHLVNLLYIRYHFYSVRQLESVSLYDVVMRWITCSFVPMIAIAPVFHVLIIGPMLQLVPKSKKSTTHEKDN